jgi:hypothetical protein
MYILAVYLLNFQQFGHIPYTSMIFLIDHMQLWAGFILDNYDIAHLGNVSMNMKYIICLWSYS